MDNIFEKLYSAYLKLISDLEVGYPISDKKLDELWKVIHDLYFVQNEHSSDNNINYLLEYYEYL